MKQNDKLHTVIKKMIDHRVLGSDKYVHNESTWLIFTNEKKWVIELTKEKTLWYNYYFFKKIFDCFKLDVVESQKIITEWVEETIINEVKSTRISHIDNHHLAEDTLQNGVKHTIDTTHHKNKYVDDTIENGVKNTFSTSVMPDGMVEDTIQNGVKNTRLQYHLLGNQVEDAIQNGVKETKGEYYKEIQKVEYAIQNGVKYTMSSHYLPEGEVEYTIENGVKKTYSDKIPHEYDWSNQFTEEIDDIIQNGVKHTEKSLQIDGSCVIEDVIKEGVIEHGIKETKSEVATREWKAGEVINGGVKETKTPGDGDISSTMEWMKEKETNSVPKMIDDIIDNGVKKTTPGGYLGSVEMKGKTVHQFEHAKQTDYVEDVIKSGIKATTTNLPLSQDDGQIAEIEDVIKNGVKKTVAGALFDEESKMKAVISEGIKETYEDAYHHTVRFEGVIKNGVKHTEPMRHLMYNPMDFSPEYRENRRLPEVTSVLECGIKEVQPLPSQEGNKDWGNYYYRQGVPTKPHTQYVNDVISEGKKI